MKVVFDLNVEAWLQGVVVEDVNSEEEALDKLKQMTLEDMLEYGFIKQMEISDVDSEISEYNIKAKVTDIEYDITDEDLEYSGMSKEEFIASKPREMVIITEYGIEDEADEESVISDIISDETDLLVDSFRYEVLERF